MSKKYEYTDLETLETADMDSVVASVWMLLNTPVNECKIVTVVEGQDDVEFYSLFLYRMVRCFILMGIATSIC